MSESPSYSTYSLFYLSVKVHFSINSYVIPFVVHLLLYIKAIGFCILTLYPATLL